ncbi:hypothetical protein ABK040_005603 [Willaertia magna]
MNPTADSNNNSNTSLLTTAIYENLKRSPTNSPNAIASSLPTLSNKSTLSINMNANNFNSLLAANTNNNTSNTSIQQQQQQVNTTTITTPTTSIITTNNNTLGHNNNNNNSGVVVVSSDVSSLNGSGNNSNNTNNIQPITTTTTTTTTAATGIIHKSASTLQQIIQEQEQIKRKLNQSLLENELMSQQLQQQLSLLNNTSTNNNNTINNIQQPITTNTNNNNSTNNTIESPLIEELDNDSYNNTEDSLTIDTFTGKNNNKQLNGVIIPNSAPNISNNNHNMNSSNNTSSNNICYSVPSSLALENTSSFNNNLIFPSSTTSNVGSGGDIDPSVSAMLSASLGQGLVGTPTNYTNNNNSANSTTSTSSITPSIQQSNNSNTISNNNNNSNNTSIGMISLDPNSGSSFSTLDNNDDANNNNNGNNLLIQQVLSQQQKQEYANFSQSQQLQQQQSYLCFPQKSSSNSPQQQQSAICFPIQQQQQSQQQATIPIISITALHFQNITTAPALRDALEKAALTFLDSAIRNVLWKEWITLIRESDNIDVSAPAPISYTANTNSLFDASTQSSTQSPPHVMIGGNNVSGVGGNNNVILPNTGLSPLQTYVDENYKLLTFKEVFLKSQTLENIAKSIILNPLLLEDTTILELFNICLIGEESDHYQLLTTIKRIGELLLKYNSTNVTSSSNINTGYHGDSIENMSPEEETLNEEIIMTGCSNTGTSGNIDVVDGGFELLRLICELVGTTISQFKTKPDQQKLLMSTLTTIDKQIVDKQKEIVNYTYFMKNQPLHLSQSQSILQSSTLQKGLQASQQQGKSFLLKQKEIMLNSELVKLYEQKRELLISLSHKWNSINEIHFLFNQTIEQLETTLIHNQTQLPNEERLLLKEKIEKFEDDKKSVNEKMREELTTVDRQMDLLKERENLLLKKKEELEKELLLINKQLKQVQLDKIEYENQKNLKRNLFLEELNKLEKKENELREIISDIQITDNNMFQSITNYLIDTKNVLVNALQKRRNGIDQLVHQSTIVYIQHVVLFLEKENQSMIELLKTKLFLLSEKLNNLKKTYLIYKQSNNLDKTLEKIKKIKLYYQRYIKYEQLAKSILLDVENINQTVHNLQGIDNYFKLQLQQIDTQLNILSESENMLLQCNSSLLWVADEITNYQLSQDSSQLSGSDDISISSSSNENDEDNEEISSNSSSFQSISDTSSNLESL